MVKAGAPSRRPILMVLFFGVLMAALDIAIVAPALPALRDHFGVDARAGAWIINTFILFNLVGLPLMARLSDLFGRRRVYIIDVLLFAVGSLVVAYASSFTMMLIGRGVQGLAASGIFPVASAVVGDVYPQEKRGRALGVLGAVFGLAFLVGPIIGGILLRYGWSWLFLLNVPIALTVAVLAYRILPHRPPRPGQQMDWGGTITVGLLLASLAYGINGIDADNLTGSLLSLRVWPFLLVAAVLVRLFIEAERRAVNPLLRLALLRNRQVALAGLFAMGAGMSEAVFIFLSGFTVVAFGVPKSAASFMLVPLVLAVMLGAPIAGRVLDRVGSRIIVLGSTALVTLGMAVLGLLATTTTLYYVGSVLVGLGLSGLLGSSISYILLNESQVEERTVAQGISTLFISVGQLLGTAFIGAMVASSATPLVGYERSFLALAVLALLLVFAALGLKHRRDEHAARKEPTALDETVVRTGSVVVG